MVSVTRRAKKISMMNKLGTFEKQYKKKQLMEIFHIITNMKKQTAKATAVVGASAVTGASEDVESRISVLKNMNEHSRDKHIRFQEEGHIYYVKGCTGYVSATKFVHNFSRPFDADAIIAKMLASGRNKNYEGMKPWEIKKLWNDNGKIARDMGTKMHFAIECYYNDNAVAERGIDDGLWQDLDIEHAQFKNFLKIDIGLVPYRTEWCIYHEELKLTGCVDMVFRNASGGYDIYDWKRTKEIKCSAFDKFACPALSHLPECNFWLYSLQLNVYKFILEDKYGLRIDNLFLVAFHPDQKNFKKYSAPNLHDELIECFQFKSMMK